jgi:cathepsin X
VALEWSWYVCSGSSPQALNSPRASHLISILTDFSKDMDGEPMQNKVIRPLPHTYITDLPNEFSWSNVNGKSYLTRVLNQHIPQYCGSCWAHASMSALADRIKISNPLTITEIELSIQFILNCGGDGPNRAGSCLGGSAIRAYQFIEQFGYIPYATG